MNKLHYLLFALLITGLSVSGQTVKNNQTGDVNMNVADDQSICANIPNYFTPDRNGIDDEWCVKSSGADKCILRLWTPGGSHIYWDKAYTLEDNRTTCLWDNGIGSGGTIYPDGVYYYKIRFLNTDTGTEREFQGSVTILGSTGKSDDTQPQ